MVQDRYLLMICMDSGGCPGPAYSERRCAVVREVRSYVHLGREGGGVGSRGGQWPKGETGVRGRGWCGGITIRTLSPFVCLYVRSYIVQLVVYVCETRRLLGCYGLVTYWCLLVSN